MLWHHWDAPGIHSLTHVSIPHVGMVPGTTLDTEQGSGEGLGPCLLLLTAEGRNHVLQTGPNIRAISIMTRNAEENSGAVRRRLHRCGEQRSMRSQGNPPRGEDLQDKSPSD